MQANWCATLFLALAAGPALFGAEIVLHSDGTANGGIGTVASVPRACARFSVEAWVRPERVTGENPVWAQFAPGWAGRSSLQIHDGHAAFYNGDGNDWTTGTTAIVPGAWHHLAVVHDTASCSRLYLDGRLEAASATPPAALAPAYCVLANLLHAPDGTRPSFCGDLAEIRVWTNALDEAQIRTNLTRRLNGTEANLYAYWPLSHFRGDATLEVKSGAWQELGPHFTAVTNDALTLASVPLTVGAGAAGVTTRVASTTNTAYRQLFFDDQRLYVRENLERVYGQPRLEAIYQDPVLANEYGWAWAVDGPDGLVHLMYMGEHKDSHRYILAAAVSRDGVHFEPRNTAAQSGIASPEVPNQFLSNPPNGEPGAVLVDPLAPPSERYKMLFCDYAELNAKWRVIDCVYSSPDLVRWRRIENSCWNEIGTEPLLGAFHNDVHRCITIISRPDWGQRRVGVVETRDWHAFTDLELCLQPDSIDPPLTEIYGMPAFPYEGYFVGFPHIYGSFPQTRSIKFFGGKMHCELAYSLNGRHWQRSLRQPFLDATNAQLAARMGAAGKMLFLTSLRRDKDGSILLYGSTTLNEHGTDSSALNPERCAVFVFRLRPDGFIALKTPDAAVVGRLASRALILKGDRLSFNLQAAHATCAVFQHEAATGVPLAGFAHEDCTPFAGDSTCWRPVWKGKSLSELRGRLLVVELKLRDGTVYSFSVDGVPQMEIEAERYRHLGIGVARPGF